MKTFSAKASFRSDDVASRVMVSEAGETHRLSLRHERGAAAPKSPDGHAWGYAGSGPAQLALDLLWEVYGRCPAPPLLQQFKAAFVAKLDQDAGFTVTEERIREIVEALGGWKPAFPEGPIEARSVVVKDDWGQDRLVGGFGSVGRPGNEKNQKKA
jgi:hypothetical protein